MMIVMTQNKFFSLLLDSTFQFSFLSQLNWTWSLWKDVFFCHDFQWTWYHPYWWANWIAERKRFLSKLTLKHLVKPIMLVTKIDIKMWTKKPSQLETNYVNIRIKSLFIYPSRVAPLSLYNTWSTLLTQQLTESISISFYDFLNHFNFSSLPNVHSLPFHYF